MTEKIELHGLLLIDKPTGITSHDVVSQVRRSLKIKEVGHAGTLDPLASGLMILLLGEATKLSQYILERDKSYAVDVRFGYTTDSLDITGNKLEEFSLIPELSQVLLAAQALQGKQELPVPKVSAVKVDGKKLYEYAREGIEIKPILRTMEFYEVKYLGQSESQEPRFAIHCSKGTYIRAWVQALGERLGTGAVMSALRRTQSAPYALEQATSLKNLQQLGLQGAGKAFIPLEQVMPEVPRVRAQNFSEALIKNGQIANDLRRQILAAFNPDCHELIKVHGTDDPRLLAIVGVEKNKGFVIRRVFKY